MLDGLEKEMHGQALRYAVQRQMFCCKCESILDYRRAVLIELPEPKTMALYCGKCFDTMMDKCREGRVSEDLITLPDTVNYKLTNGVEITDGRNL